MLFHFPQIINILLITHSLLSFSSNVLTPPSAGRDVKRFSPQSSPAAFHIWNNSIITSLQPFLNPRLSLNLSNPLSLIVPPLFSLAKMLSPLTGLPCTPYIKWGCSFSPTSYISWQEVHVHVFFISLSPFPMIITPFDCKNVYCSESGQFLGISYRRHLWVVYTALIPPLLLIIITQFIF